MSVAEIEGVTQTLQAFASVARRLQKKTVRKAVTKASRSVAKIAKSKAPKLTGLLKKSIGQKVKTYPSGHTVGIIGPRTGFRRSVSVKVSKRGKRSLKLGKKGEKGSRYRNPIKYAHLVELGTDHSRAYPFIGPAGKAGEAILKRELIEAVREAVNAEAKQ